MSDSSAGTVPGTAAGTVPDDAASALPGGTAGALPGGTVGALPGGTAGGGADRPLVVAEHLVRHFHAPGGGLVRAVDDVSFQIRPGETFGLVGESGSGKSTVARLLLGLDRPTAGQVRFDDEEISGRSERDMRALRRRMQMVFQDPYAALNRRKRVEQIVGLPLAVHLGLSRAERAARVRELLDMVGLRPEFADRYPHEMSGGQCQRVGIARAIALEPRLVVLDEAVSAVDVSIQAQILNLLKDLQRRLGLTYLFVSHDLSLVRYMSDRIAVMYHGRVVELAERAALFAEPRHPYTVSLLDAVPIPDPSRRHDSRDAVLAHKDKNADTSTADTDTDTGMDTGMGMDTGDGGCRFRPRCPVGRDRERCASSSPELLTIAAGHAAACHFAKAADEPAT